MGERMQTLKLKEKVSVTLGGSLLKPRLMHEGGPGQSVVLRVAVGGSSLRQRAAPRGGELSISLST